MMIPCLIEWRKEEECILGIESLFDAEIPYTMRTYASALNGISV